MPSIFSLARSFPNDVLKPSFVHSRPRELFKICILPLGSARIIALSLLLPARGRAFRIAVLEGEVELVLLFPCQEQEIALALP